jgi:cell division protein FtsA
VDNEVIVSVDIGDHKICVIVGEMTAEGTLSVIGVGTTPAHGVKRGMVVSMEDLSSALSTAIDRAERVSGYQIHRAEVSIGGSHLTSSNSRGVVAVARPNHLITNEDVSRALEAARAVPLAANREVLHVIPRYFVVDGQEGVPNPVGMYGFRLEVEAHIVTASSLALQNVQRCMAQAGIEVREMVAAPLAAGEAVLTQEEREMGAVVADIGGGATGVAIFTDGQPFYTNIIKVGGQHITNDLTVGLRVPFAAAEEVKIRYGHALSSTVDAKEVIEVPGEGREKRAFSRLRTCEIIEDRAAEIFAMILNDIKKSGHDGLLPGGLVITGGGAELPGMVELGREIVGLPVRIGAPQGVGGVVDSVASPAYACCVGLLTWGVLHEDGGGSSGRGGEPTGPGLREMIEGFFKRLMRMFGGSGG